MPGRSSALLAERHGHRCPMGACSVQVGDSPLSTCLAGPQAAHHHASWRGNFELSRLLLLLSLEKFLEGEFF